MRHPTRQEQGDLEMANLTRRTSAIFGLAILLLASLISAQAATATTPTSYIAVQGARFDPARSYTLEQVRAMAARAQTTSAVHASRSKKGVVTPYSVASGFVLYNPGYRRSDYVYDSDWGKITELACNGSCQVVSTYQTRIHEYIVGGSSRQWQITLYYQHLSGNYASYFSYWYACAINVSGSPDHYCQNGADPSGTTGVANSGEVLYRYFEYNSYKNTEYPMVGLGVHWPQVSNQNDNRGWDVCTAATTTKLCTSSGTGY